MTLDPDCWSCGETCADVARAGRTLCYCTTHVEDEQPDDEYQGRTLDQELASFGALGAGQ